MFFLMIFYFIFFNNVNASENEDKYFTAISICQEKIPKKLEIIIMFI